MDLLLVTAGSLTACPANGPSTMRDAAIAADPVANRRREKRSTSMGSLPCAIICPGWWLGLCIAVPLRQHREGAAQDPSREIRLPGSASSNVLQSSPAFIATERNFAKIKGDLS